MTDEIFLKWEASGLLTGLSIEDSRKMAFLLENQLRAIPSQLHPKASDALNYVTEYMTIGLVRRIFSQFLSEIEVMETPTMMVGDREVAARSRWLGRSTMTLPHYGDYNCRGYYAVECEIDYIDEISPLIIEGVRSMLDEYAGRKYYAYTPFHFVEAPLIANGAESRRFSILTRGWTTPYTAPQSVGTTAT